MPRLRFWGARPRQRALRSLRQVLAGATSAVLRGREMVPGQTRLQGAVVGATCFCASLRLGMCPVHIFGCRLCFCVHI